MIQHAAGQEIKETFGCVGVMKEHRTHLLLDQRRGRVAIPCCQVMAYGFCDLTVGSKPRRGTAMAIGNPCSSELSAQALLH